MKQILTLTMLLLVAVLAAQNVDWQWVCSYGASAEERGLDIAVDAEGNVYTTGEVGLGVTIGSLVTDGSVFVTKHNSQGELIWAVSGGNNATRGLGIALDPSGNVYIHGTYVGAATFGTTTLPVLGQTDLYVAKLNNNGIWQWAVHAGGTSYDYAKKIAVDSSGNAYITGTTHEGSFGPFLLSGSWRAYIAKLNTEGIWQWVQTHTANSYDASYDITVDSNDDIYYYTTVFGSVTAGSFSFTSNHMDIFIGKLDPDGNWLTYYRSTGSAPEYSDAITTAPDGSIYVTGYFYTQLGSPLFGTIVPPAFGTLTLLIGKISTTGAWEWVQSGGTGGSSQSNRGYGVASDTVGNVYVTGKFNETATYGPTSVVSQGSIDIFITSLDSSGNWRWANSAGGTGSDIGWGIAALGVDEVFSCGQFANTAYFGDISVSTEPNIYSRPDIYIAGFGYPAPAGPMTPANLVIQVTNGMVELSWDEVELDTGGQPISVDRYYIYNKDTPSGEFIFLAKAPCPSSRCQRIR